MSASLTLDLGWLPPSVGRIAAGLAAVGHRTYLVGGALRDHLLGRPAADYDLATTAPPTVVLACFPEGIADDAAFGRVLVGETDVLTLRREAEYRDLRRPSQVRFTRSVRLDLARRDFTVNAMALDLADGRLRDPFGGQTDLARGLLRTVGAPGRRLGEDALRILRAVRLRAQLGFSYHPALAAALPQAASSLAGISAERIRDELGRLLISAGAGLGLRDLCRYRLLEWVLPECVPMMGLAQPTPMHLFDVWEHSVRAVETIAPTVALRWAALLHDSGKPATRARGADGETHFYGHERVGAEVADRLLRRLRLPERQGTRIVALVRQHMFHYGPETGMGAARRLLLALGPDGVDDLLELRRADRHASRWGPGYGPEGTRLRQHCDQILAAGERLRLTELAVDGHDVMALRGIAPGPAVGAALRSLHRLVLDDVVPNEREALRARLVAGDLPEPEAGADPGRGV